MSTIAGRPPIIQSLDAQAAPPSAAIGIGVLTGQIRQPDGSTFAMAIVSGHSNPLGKFTGQFQLTIPRDRPPIVAEAFLKDEAGSPVRLTITLNEKLPNSDKFYFGTFTIAAGPGQYSGPGAGTASVMTGPAENALRFIFKGRYAPIVP